MRDIARNFLGLIFLVVAADTILVAVFISLIIANYLACKSSFDHLGYDGLPLSKEAFIGQIVGPFFPEATLSHFYAFVLAVVIAVGLFILCNRLFHIWELLKDRKSYLAQNDGESARIILYQIYDDIIVIITILPFLIMALSWDVGLFMYRSVVGALGIEDPAQAPLTVGNWDNQLKNHGHLFAWTLTPIGAFGYIGVTGVAAASLDYCFRRTTERFMILLNNIEHIFLPDTRNQQQVLNGYDANRQPVYDPAVPIAYDSSWNPVKFYGFSGDGYPVYDPQTPLAYDTDGNPIKPVLSPEEKPADSNSIAGPSPEPHQYIRRRINSESSQDQSAAGTHNTEAAEIGTTNAGVAASDRSDDSQGSLFNDEEIFQNIGGRSDEDTQMKDVIGKAGERVNLATAMTDKERYWVDPDSMEIWDRDYRRTLFPGTC